MDYSCQRSNVSIAQVLLMNQDDNDMIEEEESPCDHAGSSKQSSADDFVKSSNKRKIMHCVMNPVEMKFNSLGIHLLVIRVSVTQKTQQRRWQNGGEATVVSK
ncbi:hypothetical protein Q3G72_024218 [Acer saccharum]|nr:hypothetical protein Q3G72_024218 [Acer saccharum]